MTTTEKSSTKSAIRRAHQLVGVFRDIDPDMPLGAAMTLILIAEGEKANGEGLTVTELGEMLSGRKEGGLSTASRYIQYLGKRDRHLKPGKDLVSAAVDPMNNRRKILRLTAQGRGIVSLLEKAIGG